MISGRPPYDGESPVAVAIKHINGGAVMPSLLNPNIPGGLEQIIMKAMAHEPENRYTTATVMLNDLDEFRKNPAILFDYNSSLLDEVAVVKRTPVVPAAEPKVNPERTPRQTNRKKTDTTRKNKNKSVQSARKRAPVDDGKSRVAVVATITCSFVMVAAIIIFLIVLFNGGLFGMRDNLVQVPNLEGKKFDELQVYPDFEIAVDQRMHDDSVPNGHIISQKPEPGKMVAPGKIFVIVSDGPMTMSDVIGQEYTRVKSMLENMDYGLNVSVERIYDDTVLKDHIVRTEPAANAALRKGGTVTLYVSDGPDMQISQMPNIVGDLEEDAKATLDRQGLNLKYEVEKVTDNLVPEGCVVRTEPAKGEDLKKGDTVKLFISDGPEKATLPNVVGMEKQAAIAHIKSFGFETVDVIEMASPQPAGTIINQDPISNDKISVLTKIQLVVSLGNIEPPVGDSPGTLPEE